MNEIERAAERANAGIASEVWYFLRQSKKWWLFPIIATFVLFAVLMLLSSSAAAPFIYTLF